MDKPIKPIEPDVKDYRTEGKIQLNSPYVVAYRTYQKKLAKYNEDIETYEQTKFIEDIKRSTLKLCLKKYKIQKQ